MGTTPEKDTGTGLHRSLVSLLEVIRLRCPLRTAIGRRRQRFARFYIGLLAANYTLSTGRFLRPPKLMTPVCARVFLSWRR